MKKFKTLTELFKNKKRWTQYTNARNKRGNKVRPKSRSAVAWCLNGGLIRIYSQNWDVSSIIQKRVGYGLTITAWNDNPKRKIEDIRKLVKGL